MKGNRDILGKIPLVRAIRDIRNYSEWIKTFRIEKDNPQSKFNKLGLDHNWAYTLYLTVSLSGEDSDLPENLKRLRLMERLTPVHQYLDSELGFAGSILPEFNQFYDELGNPTLTYGIVYRFVFEELSIGWIFKRIFFIGLLIFVLYKLPIFSFLNVDILF